MRTLSILPVLSTLFLTGCATPGTAARPVTAEDLADPNAKAEAPAPTPEVVLPKRLRCVGEDVLETGEDRPRHYARAEVDKVWHLWLILRCQDGGVYLGDPSREPEDGVWYEDAMISMAEFRRAIKRSSAEAEDLRQPPPQPAPSRGPAGSPMVQQAAAHPLAPGQPVANYRTGRALQRAVATNCKPPNFEGLVMDRLAYTAGYMDATHVALYSEDAGMYLPVRSCATRAPLATGHLDDDGDGSYEMPFEVAPVNRTVWVPSRTGSSVRMLWLRCDEYNECQVLRRDRCQRNRQREQKVGMWACPD